MYRELQPFLIGKQVILMTATPQNTTPWNVYNQIKLFHQTEENIFPNKYEEPHLRNLFNKVEKNEYKLPDLLKYIVIRRTRKHIKQFYVSEDYNIQFPKRELRTEVYSINETYNNLYDSINELLKQLKYARYNLWKYVKPEKQEVEPYIQLKKVIRTLKIFHKINLFKRLESSIFAFRVSISNLINIYSKFLRIIEEKYIVPAGEKIQEQIYRYELDDIWDKIDGLTKDYKTDDFNIEKLKSDLKFDLKIFNQVHKYLETIPDDDDCKYDKLVEIINDLQENKEERKVLIFSEYADTVEYLHKRISREFSNSEVVSGRTSGNDEKISTFSPIANEYNGDKVVDILVATDIVSEGFNLQDCSSVINYDLHWNPVRLIQRAGRVDRIGSEADKIYVRNFLPVTQVEKEIKIKEKLERRIKEIHRYIGEDEKILTEQEKLNDSALYTIYDKRDIEELEALEEPDFTLDEAEQIIRNLMKMEPEYMYLITKMQLGLHSSKRADKMKGSYAFFRSGEYCKLFIKKEEKIFSDINDIITEIKCEPCEIEQNTKEQDVNFFFDNINYLNDHFKELINEESQNIKIHIEIRKAKQKLQVLIRDKTDSIDFIENAEKIDKVLNARFPYHLIPLLKRINKEEKDDNFFSELVKLYNSEKLSEIFINDPGKKEPIEFICGEIIK